MVKHPIRVQPGQVTNQPDIWPVISKGHHHHEIVQLNSIFETGNDPTQWGDNQQEPLNQQGQSTSVRSENVIHKQNQLISPNPFQWTVLTQETTVIYKTHSIRFIRWKQKTKNWALRQSNQTHLTVNSFVYLQLIRYVHVEAREQ